MFSTQPDNCIPICLFFDIISLFAAELEEPQIGLSGEGLRGFKMKSQILDSDWFINSYNDADWLTTVSKNALPLFWILFLYQTTLCCNGCFREAL